MTQATDYESLARHYATHRRPHPGVLRCLTAGLGPGSRVLEVGCGTGNYLGAIRESTGCEAFGVDPSPEMLAQLRARALPVRVREGHAEQLDFPAGTFDLVYSVDVIHHVVDRETAYREAARALRPGGVVCTVTDSEWIIRHRTPQSVYFPETIAVELARYPSIEALRSMMVKAGFESPSEEVVEHSYELTDAVAYREKVFSSLLYISDEAFSRGLAKLEADLLRGPVPCTSRYLLLRGNAPGN